MELSLNETMLIIESAAAYELRTALMWVCLSALTAIVVGSLIAYTVRKLAAVYKRDKILAVVSVAGIVASMLYGGISNGYDFRFINSTGVYDAGSWIDAKTGEVHAFWTHDEWVSGYKLKWFYTYKYDHYDLGPFQLPDANVSACHAEFTLPTYGDDWKSVVITCYTEYVPPIHVVTNGVYHLDGIMRSIDSTNAPLPKYVTPGITIRAGDHILAPITNSPPVPSSVNTLQTNQNQGE